MNSEFGSSRFLRHTQVSGKAAVKQALNNSTQLGAEESKTFKHNKKALTNAILSRGSGQNTQAELPGSHGQPPDVEGRRAKGPLPRDTIAGQ